MRAREAPTQPQGQARGVLRSSFRGAGVTISLHQVSAEIGPSKWGSQACRAILWVQWKGHEAWTAGAGGIREGSGVPPALTLVSEPRERTLGLTWQATTAPQGTAGQALPLAPCPLLGGLAAPSICPRSQVAFEGLLRLLPLSQAQSLFCRPHHLTWGLPCLTATCARTLWGF